MNLKELALKILHLTLKRQFFDDIAAEEKKTEYREVKTYWIKRLVDATNRTKDFDEVHFKNGYSKTAPFMRVECLGVFFNDDQTMFEINLGEILEIKW